MKLRLEGRWQRSRVGDIQYYVGDYWAAEIRPQRRKGLPWLSELRTETPSSESHDQIYSAIRRVHFRVEDFFAQISPDIEIVHPPEEETAALFTEVQQP
jgi:hypothetical protein